MAGFLRKKIKQDNPVEIPEKPAALLASSSPPSTPVYARFASTLADLPTQKPLASGPTFKQDSVVPSESVKRSQPYGSLASSINFESRQDYALPKLPKAVPKSLFDKPLPPTTLPTQDDPLVDLPPKSNLPPSRRVSASLQHHGSLTQPHVYKSSTVTGGGPLPQHNDSRNGRRISASLSSNDSRISLPPNGVPPLPAKEKEFLINKKSSIAPSAFTRPLTSPASNKQGSVRSLFRKTSAQDLQHRDSSSSKLRSPSRHSVVSGDMISRQVFIDGETSKPILPSGGSRREDHTSQQNSTARVKRSSQDFNGLQQERKAFVAGPDPSGSTVIPKGKQHLLPPSSALSRSSDNLKGPLLNTTPPQQHPTNMEVLRPTHPSAHIRDLPSQGRHGVFPQMLPPQPDPSQMPKMKFNAPTRGKPLIFAAIAAGDLQSDAFSPFQQPQPLRNSPPRNPQPVNGYPSPPAEPYSQARQNQGDPAQKLAHSASYAKHPPSSANPITLTTSPPRRNPSPVQSPPFQSEQLFVQPKQRKTSVAGSSDSHHPRTLIKQRPVTPVSPNPPAKKATSEPQEFDLAAPVGIPLDDDPFAKPEGVKLLKPTSRDGLSSRDGLPARSHAKEGSGNSTTDTLPIQSNSESLNGSPPRPVASIATTPPITPEEYRYARSKRRGEGLEKAPPGVAHIPLREDRPAEPFPLHLFLANPSLLKSFLVCLTFYDWCILSSVTKKIRLLFIQNRSLTEVALERFLMTVGYARWTWNETEPLPLSLMDLHNYMRGISIPTHEYARTAGLYVPELALHPSQRNLALLENVRHLTAATRAYTRVVLRLRAQAEKESTVSSNTASQRSTSASGKLGYASRASPSRSGSRPPSPTASSFSHSHSGIVHSPPPRPFTPTPSGPAGRSPLYRLRRAPLLRVFVPSPDGDWLSDVSVLECEAELKRAGVQHLLRMGDVVWDVAVGDEGNVGRLVWDGSYLIDLDYSYSTVGDLPKYLPTLAFPPSYFHRVIRTGPASGNPLIRLDLSPWGPEIAANLQLLQDRIRTETPQGAVHNVVRWVHRSSFFIRPPVHRRPSTKSRPSSPSRIPIPDSHLFVDPGWYGAIVVETEGTNECLADLQDRCGPGAFPPRAMAVSDMTNPRDKDSKLVFRILRERSRPGEIWIRAVGPKERLL